METWHDRQAETDERSLKKSVQIEGFQQNGLKCKLSRI